MSRTAAALDGRSPSSGNDLRKLARTVRKGGRVVNVSAVIATAVNVEGHPHLPRETPVGRQGLEPCTLGLKVPSIPSVGCCCVSLYVF
jgi:hypothetical protein